MSQAKFQFFGDLNSFLKPTYREKLFVYSFKGTPAIKHLIESLRIPHTEVGKILVNNLQVDLTYLVQLDDHIQVFPITNMLDGDTQQLDLIELSEEKKFLLDNHLGRLAVYMRMLGFDVNYRNDYQDDELVSIARAERRILLTRDRGLLMRSVITKGYYIRNKDPKQQINEVLKRFNLFLHIDPFHRCLRCNSPLNPVDKENVENRLQPLTQKYYNEFHICPSCDQIYWKGSHYKRMLQLVDVFLGANYSTYIFS